MPNPFPSKRAPAFKDVPDEKWNDWRWQLSHRLNTVEEFEPILKLTEFRAQSTLQPGALPCGCHTLLCVLD